MGTFFSGTNAKLNKYFLKEINHSLRRRLLLVTSSLTRGRLLENDVNAAGSTTSVSCDPAFSSGAEIDLRRIRPRLTMLTSRGCWASSKVKE
jgi:hypothetical protein